jgi:hypothetical protein
MKFIFEWILWTLLLIVQVKGYPEGYKIPAYFCGPLQPQDPKFDYPKSIQAAEVETLHRDGDDLVDHTNVVWIAPNNADINTAKGNYIITPGMEHTFALVVNCLQMSVDAGKVYGFNADGVHLTGFFAYAMDTGTGERIGSWVNVGSKLTNWSACNLNGKYSNSVGIVNSDEITDNPSLGGLIWKAPAQIVGNVRFIGAAVTDCGFGKIDLVYNVSGNAQTAPSITAQGLIVNSMMTGKAFVAKDASPDLDQNVPYNGATVVNNGNTVSQGAAAGIGIGSVVFGAVIGAGIMLVFRKRAENVKTPLLM